MGFTADPHTLVPPYRYIVLSQAFRPSSHHSAARQEKRISINLSTGSPLSASRRYVGKIEDPCDVPSRAQRWALVRLGVLVFWKLKSLTRMSYRAPFHQVGMLVLASAYEARPCLMQECMHRKVRVAHWARVELAYALLRLFAVEMSPNPTDMRP